jgi:hypothetical protein
MDCELLVGLHRELLGGENKHVESSYLTPAPKPKSRSRDSILDAIAEILVSQPSHEAVACAVQVDQKLNEIVITVASTSSTDIAVKEHLQDVWQRLKEVGDACGRLPFKINKHTIPPLEIQLQLKELYACIYQFSFERVSRIVFKQCGNNSTRFDEFSKRVDIYRNDPRFDPIIRQLISIQCEMRSISRILRDGTKLRGSSIVGFLNHMLAVRKYLHHLLGSKRLKDSLQFFCAEEGMSPFIYISFSHPSKY